MHMQFLNNSGLIKLVNLASESCVKVNLSLGTFCRGWTFHGNATSRQINCMKVTAARCAKQHKYLYRLLIRGKARFQSVHMGAGCNRRDPAPF